MKTHYPLIAGCCLLLAFQANSQNAGMLDTSFNGTGVFIIDFVNDCFADDVIIQPQDQKIIVTGFVYTPGLDPNFLVARILPQGGFDSTFNGNGYRIVNNFFESQGFQAFVRFDNKIVIAGMVAPVFNQYDMLVIRLNENGSLDSTFGNNGMAVHEIGPMYDLAFAAVEQTDHKIVLAGIVMDSLSNQVPAVVRLLEDGPIDSAFGTNGVAYIPITEWDNRLTSVVIQPDGKIVVSGHIDNGMTSSGLQDFDVLVARFNPDGTPDTSFGNNGVVTSVISQLYVDFSNGMQLTADNHILVCGYTEQLSLSLDGFLIQYDSTGTEDITFGTNGRVIFDNGGSDMARDVAIQPDGKILMAGLASSPPPGADFVLARYTASGVPDSSFGINGVSLNTVLQGYDHANAIDLQADGKIVLAGRTNSGSDNNIAVARYSNDFTISIQEFPVISSLGIFPNPAIPGSEVTIVMGSAYSEKLKVELYDLPGNLVTELEIDNKHLENNKHIITLPKTLGSGMYFIKVTSSNKLLSTGKLIVTK